MIGKIYELPTEHIYDRIMIVSDKRVETETGTIRECVAWNKERCRRFDTTEEVLATYKDTGIIFGDISTYYMKNKGDNWSDPKIPDIEREA